MRNKPTTTVAIPRERTTIRVYQTRTVGYLSTPQSTRSDAWSSQVSVGPSTILIFLAWLHFDNAPVFFLSLSLSFARGRKLAILQQNLQGRPADFGGTMSPR